MMSEGIRVLVIEKKHLEDLRLEAKSVWPIEACALLIGRSEAGLNLVQKVKIVRNVDASPVTFRIDPVVLCQAYTAAESRDEKIVGIFHSHPAPSTPSSIDRQYMKMNTIPWLILSDDGSLGAYQWINEAIMEVEVKIINYSSDPSTE
jgi:proteasome lid subunit RPN8/RPN11